MPEGYKWVYHVLWNGKHLFFNTRNMILGEKDVKLVLNELEEMVAEKLDI